ncbi:lactonase family protein [Actinospica robiniae]|uniref:lactonase family protein n=1 Tax=Actinospica robiniae TaxID=304901 RepID=UPI0003F76E79|nr:lactonase family protein [Actinospica robiniae]
MQGIELTVGTYTGGPNQTRGIGRAWASADGATLESRGQVTPFADPSWLVRGGNAPAGGELLYAVDEGPVGRIAAFADHGAGWFEPLGEAMPTGGAEPCYAALVGGGRFLAVANYGDTDDRGSLSLHRIEPDGSVGGQTHLAAFEGRGPHPQRQTGPHAHMVRESPDGRYILAVDLGTDSIRTFVLDPEQGSLEQVARSSFRPGFGPRHLVFHPAGGYAYVIAELGFTVAACTYDAERGEFSVLGEVPVLENGVSGEDFPSGIVISADGRFLYTANRGRDELLTFSLADPAKPERISTLPIGGAWPRDIALSPDGTLLLSANQRSDAITVFRLDPATGVPAPTGASMNVFAPACLLMREIEG